MLDKKIIAIIGMMGVGKSTIGQKIAEKLNWYFIDSDQEIEDHQHLTIPEIFQQKGEGYFREIEHKIIKQIVERDESLVLSLGGGSYIDERTRLLLRNKALVIYLHASVDEIFYRTAGKNNRPLLNIVNEKNKISKRQLIENLIKIRHPIYQQCDLDFDTSNGNQEILVNQIIKQIKSKINVEN